MTYKRWVTALRGAVKGRVFLVYGGKAQVRRDVEGLFLEKMRINEKVIFPEYKSLHNFLDDLSCLFLCDRRTTVQFVDWDADISDKQAALVFRGLSRLNILTVVNDSSDKMVEVFHKVFPSRQHIGVTVDCGKRPLDFDEFIKARAGISEIVVSKEEALRMKDMQTEDVLNMIQMLHYLGVSEVTKDLIRDFDLLRVDREKLLARRLMTDGRKTVYDSKLLYDERRFLSCVKDELVMFLRVKTVVGRTPEVRAGALKISLDLYKDYCRWADRVELKKLYDRLFMVLMLLKWQYRWGVSTMLLSLW